MTDLSLIDLSGLYWREWFATQSVSDSMLAMLARLDFVRGDAVFCCDYVPREGDPPLYRKAIYPDYKLPRSKDKEKRPPAAWEGLADTIERLIANGAAVSVVPLWEADDVIATLTEQAVIRGGYSVEIDSRDKDFFQLLRPGVTLRNGTRMITHKDVERYWGVTALQARDFQALAGDDSDHVPGCPGIGDGKAAKLLNAFGTLDQLLKAPPSAWASVPGIGPKLVTALTEWRDSGAWRLDLELVTLNNNLPLDLATILEPEDL